MEKRTPLTTDEELKELLPASEYHSFLSLSELLTVLQQPRIYQKVEPEQAKRFIEQIEIDITLDSNRIYRTQIEDALVSLYAIAEGISA